MSFFDIGTSPARSMPSSRKYLLATLVCLTVAGLGGLWWYSSRVPAQLRIGVEPLPPWFVPKGSASSGPLVTALDEVAARIGTRIRWVSASPQELESKLQRAEIDIWLFVWGPTNFNSQPPPMTNPWFRSEFILATLPGNVEGPWPIMVSNRGSQARVLPQVFPNSDFTFVPSSEVAVSTMCQGKADAAVLTQYDLLTSGVATPDCAGKEVQLAFDPKHKAWAATGYRPGFGPVAEKMVHGLQELVLSGRLDDIVKNRPGILPNVINQLRIAAQVEADRVAGRRIQYGLIAVIVVLGLLVGYLIAAERRVERALVRAQAGDRAKQEFLSLMSHEFRTPIHGFMGMVDLIRSGPLDVEQAEHASVAIQSANRLLTLVQGVLDVTDLEAGRIPLARDPVDLAPLLEAEAAELRARLRKPLTVQTEVQSGAATVALADADRLRHVVRLLLANAEKFTERGTLRLTLCKADPSCVRLEVADTGVGIPREAQDRIFEVFELGDASSSRKHEGAGLGLTLARLFVTAMGGRISVTSEPGHGSVFAVEVPAA